MWVKNSGALHKTFNVDPLYLKHENTGEAYYDNWWMIAFLFRLILGFDNPILFFMACNIVTI